MNNNDMKKCPYCAEMIKKEAIKCRYCGSMLTKKELSFDFLSTPGYWQRVNEGKKIAGVCTGIAKQIDSPVLILPLRLFFILTTFFYGFGIILYCILWILMSAPTDTPGGEQKSPGEQKDATVSEDATPVHEKKTEEEDSTEEKPVEKDTKMMRLPMNFSLLAIITVILLLIYIFVLDNVLGIAVSAVLLFFGFIFAGILLTVTVITLYFKKLITPLAKIH